MHTGCRQEREAPPLRSSPQAIILFISLLQKTQQPLLQEHIKEISQKEILKLGNKVQLYMCLEKSSGGGDLCGEKYF